MVLVTGAAGKTGRAIIQALAARGVAVRALVRREEQTAVVRAAGAQEVAVGSVQETAVLTQAMQHTRGVYHICPNMHPDEVEIGRLVLAAAKQAGVAHFVYHSVLHPQTEEMPHHWHKLQVEVMIFAAGLPFTILQPTAYLQNLLVSWELITQQGVYRVPYPVESRLSLVDVADVAEAAATVLTEPGHAGAIYELAGTWPLSQVEVANLLGQGIGRLVQAEEWPLEEWISRAQNSGMGRYQMETLVKMFQYYARFGLVGNPQVLTWLLKRPPTDLTAFVQKQLVK